MSIIYSINKMKNEPFIRSYVLLTSIGIFIFALSTVSPAQDRGGISNLSKQSTSGGTSDLDVALKKRITSGWTLNRQLTQGCYIPKGMNFFLNLNEDGSFSSQYWSNLKKTNPTGTATSPELSIYPNYKSSGTWIVTDFLLILKFENGGPPLRLKVDFKSNNEIVLSDDYELDGTEIKFNLGLIKSTSTQNEAPTTSTTESLLNAIAAVNETQEKKEMKPLSENGPTDPVNYFGYWVSTKFQSFGSTSWSDPPSNKDFYILEFKPKDEAKYVVSKKKAVVMSDYTSSQAVWTLNSENGKISLQLNDPGTGEDIKTFEVIKIHQAAGKSYLTLASPEDRINILFVKER